MSKQILILTDYRDQFWLTVRHKQASYHVSDISNWFKSHGYQVVIKQFSEIDFNNENYSGWNVIYQSTEDPYLLYNGYIVDCLLGLIQQGAILIPGFIYNRAHHNKVFMELLRSTSSNEAIKGIKSRIFGTYDEYVRFCNSNASFFPQIVKASEGSGSKNVIKIDSIKDISKAKKLMVHHDILFAIKDKIKAYLPKTYPNFKAQTNLRRKIIVQNFIDGLSCDYKVLVFDNKYYVLRRGVRPRDFRASGSGLFEFPSDISDGFLDFARCAFQSFVAPFISMDIAQKNEKYYLIEFQFVSFGTFALEKAHWHFEYINGSWEKISSQDNLEEEFCKAIDAFINKQSVEKDIAPFAK